MPSPARPANRLAADLQPLSAYQGKLLVAASDQRKGRLHSDSSSLPQCPEKQKPSNQNVFCFRSLTRILPGEEILTHSSSFFIIVLWSFHNLSSLPCLNMLLKVGPSLQIQVRGKLSTAILTSKKEIQKFHLSPLGL